MPSKVSRRDALAAGTAVLANCAAGPMLAQCPLDPPRDGRVRLSDGRWLGYREYGKPEGPLVFYFHGVPGSRLELGLNDKESCCSGARVVAIDRPGMGCSSYQSCRKVLDWPDDVEELADALGYSETKFGVIGLSGGASYAAAVAYKIPHRLTHVALVSGHAPMGANGTCPGNQDDMIELVAERPRLAKAMFKLLGRRLDRKPDKIVAQVTKNWTTADRNLILCDCKNYRQLIANLDAAMRCGPQGIITDVRLLYCHWGFQPCQIQGIPVSIWQGECDRTVTPSMGRYWHQQIPDSELILDPRAGHVTMFKWHADEILSRFL